jgi:periplasmic divalent cation tolerance protein
MPRFIQVVTTTDQRKLAEQIARRLVDERLAACVQISGPVTSVYRWQGEVCTGEEWQLCIKTRGELFDSVSAAIRRLHTYETPEILAMPVEGSAEYLAWLESETRAE